MEGGLSDSVIPTLLKARKSNFFKSGHQTWKAYFEWCRTRKVLPRKYPVGQILSFIQSDPYQRLALSTVKGQILTILFL